MENQNLKPNNQQPSSNPKPPLPPKKVEMSEAEVQSLLSVEHLQVANVSKSSKKSLLYIGVGLIVLVIILALWQKSESSKKSVTQTNNSSLPGSKSNPLNGNNINQQVQYCSNPVNAALVC